MNKATNNMLRQGLLAMLVMLVSAGSALAQQSLFFSEYIEGSSNNKALEIYNPTADTVFLDGWAFPNVSNAPSTVGEYEYWNTFPEGAFIAPNSVYVIGHPEADSAGIRVHIDHEHKYLSNGDDGYALVKGDESSFEIFDWIGSWDGDPGSGWDVSGISAATKDHTLVRKSFVKSGNQFALSSFGTDENNSE